MYSHPVLARAVLRSAPPAGQRHSRLAIASVVAGVLTWSAAPLDAQASVGGTVRDETSGLPLANAEVRIDALERLTRTDSIGRYLLDRLPAGRRVISARRIGYHPAAAIIELIAGETIASDIALVPAPALLDTLAVVEETSGIPDFDEHRRTGLGRFLTRAELAKVEQRRLGDVLGTFQGAHVLRGIGNRAWIASSRGPRTLRRRCSEREGASPAEGSNQAQRNNCACFVQVYLDDMPLYTGPGGIVPDINSFSPAEIEAIEFYTGPAQTPVKYSRLDSHCGVLVIHTRRTP